VNIEKKPRISNEKKTRRLNIDKKKTKKKTRIGNERGSTRELKPEFRTSEIKTKNESNPDVEISKKGGNRRTTKVAEIVLAIVATGGEEGVGEKRKTTRRLEIRKF
jgi:hypothetical protein